MEIRGHQCFYATPAAASRTVEMDNYRDSGAARNSVSYRFLVALAKRVATPASMGFKCKLDTSAQYLYGNLRQYDSRISWSSPYSRVLQGRSAPVFTAIQLQMSSARSVPVTIVHSGHCSGHGCSNLYSGNCSFRDIPASTHE